MKPLEKHKIVKHPSNEPFGYVFTYEDNLYRGVYSPHEEHVLQLFHCGLIDELTKNNLFPKSEVTDYRTSDCTLVIRHEKINVITLPFEWSFSMLKDAAQATLKTNIIARKYGYQIKDAHGFNILFRYGVPLFVDLGSFVKIKNEFGYSSPGWRAYGAFMRSFYAPLLIWSHGDNFFARHALHGEQVPMKTYWRYRNPLLRLLPQSSLEKLEFFYYKYKGLNSRSMGDFMQFASQSHRRERMAQWVLWLAQRRLLLFSSVNLERLSRQVQKIRPRRLRTQWGEYQAGMDITERYQAIITLIDKLKIRTILDLGGNAGLLARLILANTDADYVISADYDENAIDKLYNTLQENPASIYPVLLDFRISIADTKYKIVHERLKSEVVIALALTHHLVLSQGMTLDFIFERLRSFSSKYVFVEFMPLGCYSSKVQKIPIIPKWYNLEWFRSKFEQYFVVLEEKQLEPNRILFIGKIGSSGKDE
jgi:hypothetical protein